MRAGLDRIDGPNVTDSRHLECWNIGISDHDPMLTVTVLGQTIARFGIPNLFLITHLALTRFGIERAVSSGDERQAPV